jgi:predicted anti-sigma-YlaC factor YlaD
MECAKSLELLSDLRDGMLEEVLQTEVRTHLSGCHPCAGVFRDLDSIVLAATTLRANSEVAFPDERAIWQRMNIGKPTIH